MSLGWNGGCMTWSSLHEVEKGLIEGARDAGDPRKGIRTHDSVRELSHS